MRSGTKNNEFVVVGGKVGRGVGPLCTRSKGMGQTNDEDDVKVQKVKG